MTVARSVADVLSSHVRFAVECIDRMYLNEYQPKLQYAAGLIGYVHRQLGSPIASTAPLAKLTDRFVAAVRRSPIPRAFRGWFSSRANVRTMSCTNSWSGSPSSRGWCSSDGCRRTPVFRTEKRRHAGVVAIPGTDPRRRPQLPTGNRRPHLHNTSCCLTAETDTNDQNLT